MPKIVGCLARLSNQMEKAWISFCLDSVVPFGPVWSRKSLNLSYLVEALCPALVPCENSTCALSSTETSPHTKWGRVTLKWDISISFGIRSGKDEGPGFVYSPGHGPKSG